MDKTYKELWARVDFLTEKANILSKKHDKGKGGGKLEGILNTKDSGDQMNKEAKTSEESYKWDVYGKRDSIRERRKWISDRTKGACVIWCGRMPF